jgi:hypothetical protein
MLRFFFWESIHSTFTLLCLVLYHMGYRKKLYLYYLIILCPKGSPHFIVGVVCWLYIMTLRRDQQEGF